jgi:adenylate kinase
MADRRYKSVLLFGAPGSGKGTQGKILGTVPGFFHLASGDVFRSLDIGSTEGREVHRFISKGELVPDELTLKIWYKGLMGRIAVSDYKPREDLLILDGIPRNPSQAKLLDEYVEVLGVVHLVCADEAAMVQRIKRRAIRENRIDDANEEVIRHRYTVYRQVTEPLLACYDAAIVHEVDAMGSPAEVLNRVLDHVIPAQNAVFRGGVSES